MSDLAKHDRMANAIRALAMDAVEKAKSGHPGMPMGMADVATVLFTRYLKFDPTDPRWPDRDRFILSAGHGSMLLYSILYLLGVEDMTIDEIKHFRQLGSKTPGHPENFHTVGVETTTGPLGQGLAQRRRFCAGRAHHGRAVRRRAGRSPHLRHRLRRRPDGGHQPRGDLDRRPLPPQQADRLLRQQRHLHRRAIDADRDRRSGGALHRRRLERHAHRRAEPRRDRGGHRGGAEERQAGDDRLQDDHRLRRADQGRQVLRARLAAWRRGDRRRPQEPALGIAALRDSGRHPRRLAHRRPALQPGSQGVGEASGRRRRQPPRRVRAAHARRPAARFRRGDQGLQEDARRRRPQGGHPQGLRDGARRHQRGRAGDHRRLGRPDALQQHPHQGPQGHQARRL